MQNESIPFDPVRDPAALGASGALDGNVAHFSQPRGPDLLRRGGALDAWVLLRARHGVWPYGRVLVGAPGPLARVADDGAPPARGINFASQDYLSLAAHPAVHEAAQRALHDAGPHSAGSAVLLGNTRHSQALETALGELLGLDQLVLFPTGWAAAFGAITALVHSFDHVVIDAQAHASLRQGAACATRNVLVHRHLDCDHVRELLARIRAMDAANGILVVTEGLFSMDADSPDLPLLQHLCREYGATLLVDVAHDLGALGPGGGGVVASQRMQGRIDIVMGSFSKTFATNGGFVACAQRSARRQLQLYAGPHMFSNALSPMQAAVALECLRIATSGEGDGLRADLLRNAVELRALLACSGLHCLGGPSPIVPVWTGLESAARVAGMLLARDSVFVNPVEFPGVPLGAARLRLQLMAQHTPAQLRRGASLVANACGRAGAGAFAGKSPRQAYRERYRG
ncbi:aminotransferase class I/II-fold pyridoxal phosphate-dependent enzyme [Massilia oculi]|uniref:8-amino-7-oxononanoate synthase n=1 Tax=Massilia oculi TaxID=945844 RepID=A0A2S2DSM4_9BURK|nr:aminotransferase class I/II-fold pyridoxal phosphate-dependent enzyme [Massilia oculi]AWL07836.1 8-amino-7-oxononanoate synthase [Massilia oculi]